jgi:hypothetical protein
MAKKGKRGREKGESGAGRAAGGAEAAANASSPSALLQNPAATSVRAAAGAVGPNEAVASAAAAKHPEGALNAPPVEASSSSRPPADRLIVGWLREHGPAHHAFRPKAEPSYYLKLQTREGEQLVWGKGLERALATSRTRPQIGDEIGVREIEIRPIAPQGSPLGGGGAPPNPPIPRTHWVIERTAFFAERAAAAHALRDPAVQPRQAIREHPDLIGAYFTLDAARKVADAKIGNAESRERFVALVRETLAHAIERGELIAQAVRRIGHSAQSSRSPSDGNYKPSEFEHAR